MRKNGWSGLTEAQTAKVYENVGKIVEHIRTLQPGIVSEVVATWDRDLYGLLVTKDAIVGDTASGKHIAIDAPEAAFCALTPIDQDLDFAVSLVVNWSDVKIELEAAVEDQRWVVEAIENFEV